MYMHTHWMNGAACEACGTGVDTCDSSGVPVTCTADIYWMNGAASELCGTEQVTCDGISCVIGTYYLSV